jgi:protein-tyrosine phosphatase
VALRVLPGADVRVQADLIPKIHSGKVVTLADQRRHVLLELPHELYLPLDRLLSDLDAAGMTGILSHPERNRGILAQPRLLPPLVDAGCLLQVTAGSLLGAFGSQVQSFARWLVTQGLAHFVATDAHGSKSRRPLMRGAFDRVADLAGLRVADQLCRHNPARVVAGQRIAQGRRKPARAGLAHWLRWGKAG